MARLNPMEMQGELQLALMRAMWRLGRGNVEEIRKALPPRHRSAYQTIQTVLNRLAERGLLERTRERNMILYSPKLSEADYLSRSLSRVLDDASDEARRTALARLVGSLNPGELHEISALEREIGRKRRGRKL